MLCCAAMVSRCRLGELLAGASTASRSNSSFAAPMSPLQLCAPKNNYMQTQSPTVGELRSGPRCALMALVGEQYNAARLAQEVSAPACRCSRCGRPRAGRVGPAAPGPALRQCRQPCGLAAALWAPRHRSRTPWRAATPAARPRWGPQRQHSANSCRTWCPAWQSLTLVHARGDNVLTFPVQLVVVGFRQVGRPANAQHTQHPGL